MNDSTTSTADPNPSGLCLCGCGRKTSISKVTDRAAMTVKGLPVRYIAGHSSRPSPVEYIEQDCGYTTPCWIWQRRLSRRGYGSMEIGGAHYCVANHMHVSVYALFEWLRNAGPRWGEGPYAVDHRFTHAARAMLVADYPELEPYLKTRGSHTVLGGAR